MTKACTDLAAVWFRVACASGRAVCDFPLRSVVVVTTGRVRNTWWPQLVWKEMFPCVHATTSWSRNLVRGFPGYATTGSELTQSTVVWLCRPTPFTEKGFTFRWTTPTPQMCPDRPLDFQKCLCACFAVSCLRTLANGHGRLAFEPARETIASAWSGTSLHMLKCTSSPACTLATWAWLLG
eukprot:3635114-Amphidinium_carterae.1